MFIRDVVMCVAMRHELCWLQGNRAIYFYKSKRIKKHVANMGKDYYQTLQLTRSAKDSDIKAAYELFFCGAVLVIDRFVLN